MDMVRKTEQDLPRKRLNPPVAVYCKWCEGIMPDGDLGMSHCSDCYKELGGWGNG